jgi:hypothetical protein
MDVVSCGLLALAVITLVRRRRRAVVLVSGALAIAGWSSNLLDRLVMHGVNAPGSVRGAIDFLPVGRDLYNVADVVILGSTTVFLVAVCVLGSPGRRAVGDVLQRHPITSSVRPAGWRPEPQAARARATASAATSVGTPIRAIAAEL